MSFNIGSQNAGVINNVQGNQTVGEQHVTIASPSEARAVLQQLRAAIDELPLNGANVSEVNSELDEMDRELQRPEPDAASLGERLDAITNVLTASGAIVTAGSGLATALTSLAKWLGPFGAAALRLMRG